ncbi:MAG: FAD-dependent oxidoreductase [Nanoarchaeota archaeon]|nr:FAD-dependent oxidoreductase [Nanoarchaeota archaeon]MBU1027820.1 FAD-dependent oxidoreductase [Nanoarchaeota archaeon]
MKIYDLVIIGAGPAGLTAGLYATRDGLKVAIVGKEIGGTANKILLIENWPGFNGSGSELMKNFHEQLKKHNIEFILEDADEIKKNKNNFKIKTKKQEIESKSIILTTGTQRKKLEIPGEKKLIGRGISYCVTCDAFFFKGKNVAVIGGSDCATTSALALSDIAKKIYLVYRGKKLKCEKINLDRLEKKKNIEIFYDSIPLEIKGKEKVEALIIKQNNQKQEISLDGVFIEIGAIALSGLAKNLGLKLDKENHIIVDRDMKTSVDGFFAAGDVTDSKLKQVVVASAQGAIAAKSAYGFLRNNTTKYK